MSSDNRKIIGKDTENNASVYIEDLEDPTSGEEGKEDFLKYVFGPNLELSGPSLSLKDKVRIVFQSNRFHILVVGLVILDAICVAGELIISLENKGNEETWKKVEEFFRYLGLSILSLFMVELIIKISVAFNELKKSKLEIFDAIIVVVSFTIDVVFISLGDSAATSAISLITIMLRLWRLTRIVNGTVVTIKRHEEAKIEKLKETIRRLKIENQELKTELKKQTVKDS